MRPVQESLAEHLEPICNGIASGRSLREVCRKRGIDEGTVRYWLRCDGDAKKKVAEAKELGCDALADECVEIADDATNDWMERQRKNGTIDEVVNEEHIARSRLRIDTRLRLIGKWSQRYGEKVAHTGPDGGAIPVTVVEWRVKDAGD